MQLCASLVNYFFVVLQIHFLFETQRRGYRKAAAFNVSGSCLSYQPFDGGGEEL